MKPAGFKRQVFFQGIGFSLLAHALFLGLLLLLLRPHPSATPEINLDFSQAPRVAQRAAKARPRAVAKAWVQPKQGLAPVPQAVSEAAETQEAAPPCPPPCPDRPSDFVPAGLAARQPRWTDGFITDSDYPKVAQKNGQDGKVVVEVFLDAQGRPVDVRLLKGSYEELNQVALNKLKTARFEPAYDASGKAVPCRLILPIRFELQ